MTLEIGISFGTRKPFGSKHHQLEMTSVFAVDVGWINYNQSISLE